ncbi:MAG: oxygen-independent coproporphyrinogen III oxidase [Xanthomonadales bacterium]|nr:oxygen-independent coproporphyrinogen III oxidase [Xanthomonadales bacterium]
MRQIPAIDISLLERYNRPGPRYTSYPTAPQFHDRWTADQYRDALIRSNADPIPRRVSLYVHVPFCTSPCFYCGCNRVITRDTARAEPYVEALCAEIDQVGACVDEDREVMQIHFGGGTPNFLRPGQIARVIEAMARRFRLGMADDRDFSIEIDPRSVDPDDIAELADMGFNRASLGVQDYDPAVQVAVNRVQSRAQTEAVIAACRRAGFRSVNVDLIYGLPKQNRKSFRHTLDQVLAVRPDRLAVYSYAHLPAMFRGQKQIDEADLPSAEEKLGLLADAIEVLGDAGYVHIGMDHFALPDDELARAQRRGGLHRNFMGYTTHADCDLVGFGVSSISHVADCFSQNPRDLPSYLAAMQGGRWPTWRGLRLDEDDLVRADLIQRIMCQGYVDIDAFERRHGVAFKDYFSDALDRLQPLRADGLVELDAECLRASERGKLLLRHVAMCFDRYLGTAEPLSRFSKAI